MAQTYAASEKSGGAMGALAAMASTRAAIVFDLIASIRAAAAPEPPRICFSAVRCRSVAAVSPKYGSKSPGTWVCQ